MHVRCAGCTALLRLFPAAWAEVFLAGWLQAANRALAETTTRLEEEKVGRRCRRVGKGPGEGAQGHVPATLTFGRLQYKTAPHSLRVCC